MNTISMLINGERIQSRHGATFERRNPLDGSVATKAPAATVADAIARRSMPPPRPSRPGLPPAPANGARC